jgi:hypothetical protein
MSQAVNTERANCLHRSSSPEVVRAVAHVAAAGEIVIRKAANSAGGRLLSAAIRQYPLWSVFIATGIGFLLAPNRQPRPVAAPVRTAAIKPGTPPKSRV